MEKLFLKHKDWIKLVKSFGCRDEIAEDIVQEMYLKIGLYIQKGLDINYNDDEVNHWYVYKTLKTIYLNILKREKKVVKVDCDSVLETEYNGDIRFEEAYKVFEDTLENLYWYDKKVWKLADELGVAELSRLTDISYRSLYNTKKKVDKILKNKIDGIR